MGTTDDPKGNKPEGEPPEGKKEPPAPQDTKKDIELAVHKALSSAGRTAGQLDERENAIKAREEEIKRWQEEKDAAELKAAEDNPELLDAINLRRRIREEQSQLTRDKAQLEKERAEHATELEAAKETQKEIKIWQIADKHSVDAATLKDKAIRYKLESDEDIDDLAQSIKKPSVVEINPDSNIVTGVGRDYSHLTSRQKIEEGMKQKAKKGG